MRWTVGAPSLTAPRDAAGPTRRSPRPSSWCARSTPVTSRNAAGLRRRRWRAPPGASPWAGGHGTHASGPRACRPASRAPAAPPAPAAHSRAAALRVRSRTDTLCRAATPASRARGQVGQVVSPADCKSAANGCRGSIPLLPTTKGTVPPLGGQRRPAPPPRLRAAGRSRQRGRATNSARAVRAADHRAAHEDGPGGGRRSTPARPWRPLPPTPRSTRPRAGAGRARLLRVGLRCRTIDRTVTARKAPRRGRPGPRGSE